MSNRLITLIILVMMILVACETTNPNQDDDPLSARNQQPELVGFQTRSLDINVSTMLDSPEIASIANMNTALTEGLQRADNLLECVEETGFISSLMYIEEDANFVPQVGTSLIVNKTRVQRDLFACLTEQTFGAQSVLEIEPCTSYGEFTAGGEEFWFAYVGLGATICEAFATHYTGMDATILGTYQLP